MRFTNEFLDQCKGLTYDDALACFVETAPDGATTNWWVETYRDGFKLLNRDNGVRVDKDFALACIEGTRAQGGAAARRDGTTADVTIRSGRPQIKRG